MPTLSVVSRLVGRDQHARGRSLVVDEPQHGMDCAFGEQPAPASEGQWVDLERVPVHEVVRGSVWTSLPLPSTTMSPLWLRLSGLPQPDAAL